MNLLYMPKGATRWTVDKQERVRMEFRVGDTDTFECSVFDNEGQRVCTRRYNKDGTAVGLNDESRDLANWQ